MSSTTRIATIVRESILWQASAIAIAAFLLLIPFIYRCGAGEADSSSMVAGIYQAGLQADILSSGLFYFHVGQPLYNSLFALMVYVTGMSFDALLLLLNAIAAFSTAVSSAAIYYLCRKAAIPLMATVGGVVVFLTAPYSFELATYAHPQTLSIACVLISFCVWFNAIDRWSESRKTAYIWGTVAVATLVAGLLFRMDGIVLGTILVGIAVIKRYSVKQFLATVVAFPLASLVVALIARRLMLPEASSSGGMQLLQTLIKFMETPVATGLPRLKVALGTGGVCAVLFALAYAIIRSDYRAFIAAVLIVLPVVIYTCQNAFVPRRFVHVFSVAAIATAVAIRQAGLSEPAGADRQYGSRRRKAKSQKKEAHNSSSMFSLKSVLVGTALVIFGNWVLWPLIGIGAKTVGDPLPNTIFWNANTSFMPLRHSQQQKYFCWSKQANLEAVRNLAGPHDIIGSWLQYGELLSAYSRLKQPVSTEQPEMPEGRPQITRIKAGNITHSFYSPPWDFPPGQQSPEVLLLNDYGADVTYGLTNIKKLLPPPGIKYYIW